jgi:hypothetical protein
MGALISVPLLVLTSLYAVTRYHTYFFKQETDVTSIVTAKDLPSDYRLELTVNQPTEDLDSWD